MTERTNSYGRMLLKMADLVKKEQTRLSVGMPKTRCFNLHRQERLFIREKGRLSETAKKRLETKLSKLKIEGVISVLVVPDSAPNSITIKIYTKEKSIDKLENIRRLLERIVFDMQTQQSVHILFVRI